LCITANLTANDRDGSGIGIGGASRLRPSHTTGRRTPLPGDRPHGLRVIRRRPTPAATSGPVSSRNKQRPPPAAADLSHRLRAGPMAPHGRQAKYPARGCLLPRWPDPVAVSFSFLSRRWDQAGPRRLFRSTFSGGGAASNNGNVSFRQLRTYHRIDCGQQCADFVAKVLLHW
jgi:hypothetical protein